MLVAGRQGGAQAIVGEQYRGMAGIFGGDEAHPPQGVQGALADIRQIAHGRGHHV